MTWYRVGPAGIPGSLKTDMNTVLNKKFGTTGQDYPPADWPADVNLLGPLPIIISNKAPIVSFNDGADDVPIAQGVFSIVPSQAGTGTPSPSNPRAISGYTGMTISHAGKNLIDDTRFTSGLPSTSIGASINTITASTRYAYVNLPKGGVTFTISSRSDDTDLFNSILIYGYKDGFLYQYTNAAPGTNKTVDFSACDYIRLAIGARTASYQVPLDLTGYGYLQIEAGSTATTYSAFTSETLAVSWQTEAGTVYGGELNVTTGVLTVTWGEVDLGNLSWTYNSSYLAFYATVNDKKNGANGYIDIYDRTTYWITSQEWADANNVFYCSGGNKYLAIKNTDYSNAATFRTAMTGHKFVFELDTPVTYQLDLHELRTYYANNNFYCDTGDSQLNYRADISLYINNH